MLIAFDLEGTLVRGEFLPALGRRLGTRTLDRLTEMGLKGELSYEESLRRRVELVRGVDSATLREVSTSLPLMLGAEEAVSSLSGSGWVTAVISGGFDVLVEPVAARLGIRHVYCNRFDLRGGGVEGVLPPVVSPGRKRVLLRELAAGLGLGLEDCVAVGDGANDIPMLGAAGLGIALNAKPRVREAADVVIDAEDLRSILPIVEEYRGRRASASQAPPEEGKLVPAE